MAKRPIAGIPEESAAFAASQCRFCAHWTKARGDQCEVFPLRIPVEILTNRHDHRKPYEGDDGGRFEPLDDEANENQRKAVSAWS